MPFPFFKKKNKKIDKNENTDAQFERGHLYHMEWLKKKEKNAVLDNAAKYLQIDKDILEKADKDILEKADKDILEEKKDAQFEVGALYHRQWLKVKNNDETKANKYYKKATKYLQIDKDLLNAAENGISDAQYDVAAKYHRQWSKVKKNDETKANKYYDMAVEYYDMAVEYYKRAAEKNNTSAMYFLGRIYQKVKETEKAESMFLQAANKDMADAQYELGLIEYDNKKNYEEAMKWFVKTIYNDNKLMYGKKEEMDYRAKIMIAYIKEENPNDYKNWYIKERFNINDSELTSSNYWAKNLDKYISHDKLNMVDHEIKEMETLLESHKRERADLGGGKRTIHKRNKTRLGTRKKNKNKNKKFSRRNSRGRKKRNKRRTRKTKY